MKLNVMSVSNVRQIKWPVNKTVKVKQKRYQKGMVKINAKKVVERPEIGAPEDAVVQEDGDADGDGPVFTENNLDIEDAVNSLEFKYRPIKEKEDDFRISLDSHPGSRYQDEGDHQTRDIPPRPEAMNRMVRNKKQVTMPANLDLPIMPADDILEQIHAYALPIDEQEEADDQCQGHGEEVKETKEEEPLEHAMEALEQSMQAQSNDKHFNPLDQSEVDMTKS